MLSCVHCRDSSLGQLSTSRPAVCAREEADVFCGNARSLCVGRKKHQPVPAKQVTTTAVAFVGGGGAGVSGSVAAINHITQGVYAVGGVMGIAYIAREFLMQDSTREGSQDCPTCRGTGEVECFCANWSDGDLGCQSCNYSGRTICHSCRGGGTGVPITQNLYVRADDSRPRPPPN